MPQFSFEEKRDMLKLYYMSGNNAELACARYFENYPERRQPNRTYFLKLDRKLGERGSVNSDRRKYGSRVSKEQKDAVLNLDHFEADQFDSNKYLRSTAVPTIFSFNNESFRRQIEKRDLSRDSVKQKNKKIVVMCRTCLMFNEKKSSSIFTLLVHGRTVKDMVLRLIPQIAQTVTDDSYVCNKCVRCLCRCIEFIDNCLEFETRILDGQLVYHAEEVLQTDEEGSDSDLGEKMSPNSVQHEENTCDISKDEVIEKSPEKNVAVKMLHSSVNKSSLLRNDASKSTREQKISAPMKKIIPMKVESIKMSVEQNNTGVLPALKEKEIYENSIVKTNESNALKIDSSPNITENINKKELRIESNRMSNSIIENSTAQNDDHELQTPSEHLDEILDETSKQKQLTKQTTNIPTEKSFKTHDAEKPIAVRSSKRSRTKRKLEDCAKDEEIDAYLTENFEVDDKTKDDFESTLPRRGRRRKDEDVDYKVDIKEKADPSDKSSSSIKERKLMNKKLKEESRERESSPELQVLHNPMKCSIRTYERKKKSVTAENCLVAKDSESSPSVIDLETQQNIDEIIQPLTSLKTYDIKRETIDNKNQKKTTQGNESMAKRVDKKNTMISYIRDEPPTIINSQIAKSTSNNPYIMSPEYRDNSSVNFSNKTEALDDSPNVDSTPDDSPSDGPTTIFVDSSNEEVKGLRFQCPVCDTWYRSKRGITDHMRYVHSILCPSNHEYSCDVCCEHYNGIKELIEHRSSHGVPCDFCREIFSSSEELDLHKDSHQPIYSCVVCNRGLKSKEELIKHMSMHKLMADLQQKKELPRIACRLCGIKFQFKGRLKAHIRLVHLKQKNFKCDTCGKTFGLKSALNLHNRVRHLDDMPFKCQCGVAFKRKDYLTRHEMNKHMQYTKMGDFCCDFCGDVVENRNNFQKHLSRHANIRKYKCGFCELRFVRQNTRLVHERSHSSNPKKKFICQVCWKKFSTQNEVEMHMVYHRRLNRYKCKLCPRSFLRKMLLENHILDAHTLKNENFNR